LAIFKKSYISVAKAKNFVIFPFTYVSESPALLNGDFFMNLYSIDSNEAMKRGDEALNASLLLFLRIVASSHYCYNFLISFKLHQLHRRHFLSEIIV
jgi:hypothetical protein